MKKNVLLFAGLFACSLLRAQNVAVNDDGSAADASAILHIKSVNKGLLIPTLTLAQRGSIPSPATGLLIFQTDGTPGFYYNAGAPGAPNWAYLNPQVANSTITYNPTGTVSVTDAGGTKTSTGQAWLVGGNAYLGNGTAYRLGITTADNMDLLTANAVRGRLSAQGEFFIGATSTPSISGDLMTSVGNSSFPFAVNGLTSFNGNGVYGAVQGNNTTTYAAVQGENNSVSGGFNSTAVRGVNASPNAGTGFRAQPASGPRTGISGSFTQPGAYSFAIHGTSPSFTMRTAALFGDDGGLSYGAVAYYASDGHDYSFYGFGNIDNITTGTGGGRQAAGSTSPQTNIGLGLHGGMMAAWMRGEVYGTYMKGERYGLYVDGSTYTNKPITQLVETSGGDKIATYATASMKTDITQRGKDRLQSGTRHIPFDEAFRQSISDNPDELTITVTPMGNCNGIYIESYDASGFTVRELNNGTSAVSFSWIAIGTRKGYEHPENAPELLTGDFEKGMQAMTATEVNPSAKPGYMWWDGHTVRYDRPPHTPSAQKPFYGLRPQEEKKD